ncbi:zinc finger protein 64 1 and 2-like protein [Aphelenchoides avenae]|nr:zinc finger protein 64 1 and 2-like protein [Aphelenchus avenae]
MDPLVDAILENAKTEVKEEADAGPEAPLSAAEANEVSNEHQQEDEVMQTPTDGDETNDDSDPAFDTSRPSKNRKSNRKQFAKNGKCRTRKQANCFSCTVCDFSTPYAQVLQRHIRRHTGQKPYECELCEKAFSLRATLTQHRRTHFAEKPFKCRHCDFACSQKRNLYGHERTHFENRFQCPQCPKKLSSRHSLRRHLELHSDTVYTCDRCGHKSKSDAALDEHKRKAKCTREATLTCEHCDYKTSTAYLLREHMKRRDVNNDRCRGPGKAATATYYTCPTCRYTTSSKDRYEEHLLRRIRNRCPQSNRKRIVPSAPLMFVRAHRRFNFVDSKDQNQVGPSKNLPGLGLHPRKQTPESDESDSSLSRHLERGQKQLWPLGNKADPETIKPTLPFKGNHDRAYHIAPRYTTGNGSGVWTLASDSRPSYTNRILGYDGAGSEGECAGDVLLGNGKRFWEADDCDGCIDYRSTLCELPKAGPTKPSPSSGTKGKSANVATSWPHGHDPGCAMQEGQ